MENDSVKLETTKKIPKNLFTALGIYVLMIIFPSFLMSIFRKVAPPTLDYVIYKNIEKMFFNVHLLLFVTLSVFAVILSRQSFKLKEWGIIGLGILTLVGIVVIFFSLLGLGYGTICGYGGDC